MQRASKCSFDDSDVWRRAVSTLHSKSLQQIQSQIALANHDSSLRCQLLLLAAHAITYYCHVPWWIDGKHGRKGIPHFVGTRCVLAHCCWIDCLKNEPWQMLQERAPDTLMGQLVLSLTAPGMLPTGTGQKRGGRCEPRISGEPP